jgi:aspartate/glutamate racemase
MEHPFYREGLARYRIEVIVPPQEDGIYVDRVAFEELSRGCYATNQGENFSGS